jgi:phenylalanyl-tRNA synthetase alpha chain
VQDKINSLFEEFEEELQSALTTSDVEVLEVKYLGKKGPVQDLMKLLKDADPSERPALGKAINDLKVKISNTLEEKQNSLHAREEEERLSEETLDVSIPGRRRYPGAKHLVTRVLDQLIDILVEMGFSVQYSPEIDSHFYNFTALNFPPNHPAMDMQDTFYITDDILLRTHTTNIQARFMESHEPPIRIISPGRCYRNEDVSARSHVFFHQIDAFYVDKGVALSDLLSTMDSFLKRLFDPSIEVKFRPSYFPFVEPGVEVDVRCLVCGGEGCPICKHTGWLEIAGAGMVHPEVLKNGGIDPEVYSGFAWGIGIERLVMLKYGIKDIRIFTENDLRFLRQFV